MNDRSQGPYFLHADGDSFFAACELSARPELRGKPVVVGGDRGIAVAMSPEAKKLGVTRGMPVFKIKRQFPQIIILGHHFETYRDISNKMYDILLSYVETVERYSIDECFAAVKPSEIRFHGGELALLLAIQKEIWEKLGVSYSFGLARTKALAKTASKLRKPNGAVALLSEDDERDALMRTPIDDIWGIGWRTFPRLKAMGMKTAYDFTQYPREKIQKFFSEPLYALQCELRGQPIHHVHSDTDPRDQKSIQSTATFRPSSSDPKILWAEISENAENACMHARKLRLLTNSISFYLKTAEFSHIFAEAKLDMYTADPGTVLNAIESAFLGLAARGEKIRATGVILQNLRREEDVPRDLFGKQEKAIGKLAIEEAADRVRKKFGHNALVRLSSLRGSGKESDSSFH